MYDLHTHSNFSDGTLPPEKLIEEAKNAGLTMIALTDHDTAAGVPLARKAAEALDIPFLAGIEMEAEYADQLHILGLGVDPDSPMLAGLIGLQAERRCERNRRVLELLKADGMDVEPFLRPTAGTVTRANIARAMFDAGYCSSVGEAFKLWLGRGRQYYVPQPHPEMPEVLEAIKRAGGVSVLAHPMNMDCDHRALIESMKANGLWGVEAYYGSADRDTVEYFCSLAHEFRLRPTCGSDFHGDNRPGISLGCSYRAVSELNITEDLLRSRIGLAPAGRRRTPSMRPHALTLNEYQLMAEHVANELPEEFFRGLNGGIVISEKDKLHKKSLPGRPLYVMGEYVHGGVEGRYIILYYGSFLRTRGSLRGKAAYEEIRRILLHEFRHHLEINAGEHDLEYEDDDYIAEYLEENSGDAPSGNAVVSYGDPYPEMR